MRHDDRRTDEPAAPGRRRVFQAAGALITGSLFGAGCGGSETPSQRSSTTTATPRAGGWARGGTAKIGGGYPDPFAAGASGACALTCVRTSGPCYAKTIERKDISEGRPGLPLRLSFLLVNARCEAIDGGSVDIWHASHTGLYSADDTARMCHGDDADAKAHRFFRGMQRSDRDGRVELDTCFPGWYRGRAVHIHFTARIGDAEYVTSQLFFPPSVISDVYASHPDYATRGQPDTPNHRDGIAGADHGGLLLDVQRMDDGVMLASKSIVLRSALAAPICGDAGMGGPPRGGPPPGGRPRAGPR